MFKTLVFLLAILFTFQVPQVQAGDDRDLQEQYVKQLYTRSKRLLNAIRRNRKLDFAGVGKQFRKLGKLYRNAVKKLVECTDYDNHPRGMDRVYFCSDIMDGAFHVMFKLSDLHEAHKNLFTASKWATMLANRHALGLVCTRTDYVRPSRRW